MTLQSLPVLSIIPPKSRGAVKWTWPDRLWMRLRSLFVASVAIQAILDARVTENPADIIFQLYTWERDRLLTLAKGSAGAAVTVLTGLIASAVEAHTAVNQFALYSAAVLVVELLAWGGFLLAGLRRLAEQYTLALDLVS